MPPVYNDTRLPPPQPESSERGGGGTSTFDAGPNTALERWAPDISKAAEATGVDPNLIGAMIWAESRGNPNDPSRNVDGTKDLSLMQISQERWDNEVVGKLTDQERAKIKELTGKSAEDLDMKDPHDNVIGGAFEIQQKIREKGGDVAAGLDYYVSGGADGVGSPSYVQNVLRYQKDLAERKKLSEDPYGP